MTKEAEKTKIQIIWKVEGDSNEYPSEQEAQIAQVLAGIEGCHIDTRQKRMIAEAFNGRYFLIPIIPTVTIQETQAQADQREFDSYGPSA